MEAEERAKLIADTLLGHSNPGKAGGSLPTAEEIRVAKEALTTVRDKARAMSDMMTDEEKKLFFELNNWLVGRDMTAEAMESCIRNLERMEEIRPGLVTAVVDIARGYLAWAAPR